MPTEPISSWPTPETIWPSRYLLITTHYVNTYMQSTVICDMVKIDLTVLDLKKNKTRYFKT